MPHAYDLTVLSRSQLMFSPAPAIQAPRPRPRQLDRSGWSYLERWLYEHISFHWRSTHQPAKTRVMAELAGKHQRTLLYMLTALEKRGAIRRKGQRGGWLPAYAAAAMPSGGVLYAAR